MVTSHWCCPGQYYYYNQWMRQRIAAAAPALPEPVVAKLLDMEAGELDLLLQYPAAAAAQVRAVQLLSWLWL
jgi:glutamate/tyrosine decarboxylase-like PLP-dependent enzyme